MGRFITLEGGEGVGKSTQAHGLAEALRAQGHDVIVTREPGGTPGAEAIRALLMTGDADRWSVRAEALLFAAARADHVENVIRPALVAGRHVICDRFIDSSRAYQGGAGGVADADILELHRIGCGGLMPDRTLLLSLPEPDARERARLRAEGNADRFGARADDYHAALQACFVRLAASEPARFRIVDASGEAEAVTARLLDALA
ncbi:MAG: dTMP kinase [Sphingomonadaceae bacterium]